MTENEKKSNGLAIASLVLALVGIVLYITVIGMPLAIICFVLALIFGIIALCKKQKAGASIVGIIISALGILFTIIWTTAIGRFISNNKDAIINPINEFVEWTKENPEAAALMNDPEVKAQYNIIFEGKMQELYGEDYEDAENIKLEDLLPLWSDMFKEMESFLTEKIANETSLVDITDEVENSNSDENSEEITEIANPASAYCEENGGTIYIKNSDDGEYGVCTFENGKVCEEWAFYRGECTAEVETVSDDIR